MSNPSSIGPSYRLVGICLAMGGVVGFSLRPILIKLAYGYVTDPVTLLALRMIFSAPFFVLAALWAGGGASRRMSRRDLIATAALGALGYYVASFLDFLGLQYVSAGLGRLLLFLYPTIVVVLSALFLGKRISLREVAALLVSYVGVALVLSNLLGGQSTNLPLGAALVFSSAVIYAVYLVAGSQVILQVGSARFTAYAMIVASALCIAQFLLLRPLAALDLPLEVYGLAIAMAVVCTVIPVFMMSEALRRIGANHSALIGALGPVSTVVLGYLGLDEFMTPLQLVGAALVLAGVLIISLKPKSG